MKFDKIAASLFAGISLLRPQAIVGHLSPLCLSSFFNFFRFTARFTFFYFVMPRIVSIQLKNSFFLFIQLLSTILFNSVLPKLLAMCPKKLAFLALNGFTKAGIASLVCRRATLFSTISFYFILIVFLHHQNSRDIIFSLNDFCQGKALDAVPKNGPSL